MINRNLLFFFGFLYSIKKGHIKKACDLYLFSETGEADDDAGDDLPPSYWEATNEASFLVDSDEAAVSERLDPPDYWALLASQPRL